MLPAVTLGWVAGIIDLKGRLIYKVNKQRATDQVVLIVESKELGIIRQLGRLTGTKPDAKIARPIKDFMRRGCLEHCPESHVHVNDFGADREMPPVSRWTITGAGMVVIIDNVLPYLCVDRDWEAAMETVRMNTVLEGQGSGAVFATLSRLKALSWDLPADYEEALLDRLAKQEPEEELV